MANHLLRDYPLDDNGDGHAQVYIAALFIRRVLRYTIAGETNFDIDTNGGSFLAATGDTTPSAGTPTFPVGRRAGINFGGGAETHVEVNSSDHTVSAGDIGRILVLRSTANPQHNSGLFAITGVDVGNNRFIIDFRSSEDPPAEAVDSLDWYLYENEASAPSEGAENGGSGYRSDGTSTTPRILFQSPHATGWQVRFCLETNTDYFTNHTVPYWTSCPGFGGDSAGDFPNFGRHTHNAMWLDTADIVYKGTTVGGGIVTATADWRVYAIGDDTGQAVALFFRFDSGTGDDQMVILGIPDNEPAPLPDDDAERLFVFGNGDSFNSGNYLNEMSLRMGGSEAGPRSQGMSYNGTLQQPVSAEISPWVFSNANSVDDTPGYDANAADSPFSGTTELLTIEILQGISDDWYVGTPVLERVAKIMGTIPFIRQGRTNVSNFTLSDDQAWIHMRNETWVDWQGPAVLA